VYAPREVIASVARTITGESGLLVAGGAIQYGRPSELNLLVDATAVSGTGPSMTLSVQWSVDQVVFAAADPADEFTAITAPAALARRFALKAPFYRVVWTIAGTLPSFTFSVHEFVR
jgi:hypothetical protein